jgi:N-methylhydantoinase B
MTTDPVLLEILRNRFKAVVEEMATVTLRTGFTVFVKETSDFGACLVAPNGELLAAPTETSVSLMVGLPGWEAINAFAAYEPGDIGIANDPDTTRGLSTHLPDIFLWKPIFVDGRIIAFAFNFIHSSDVGGRVPGSISPISTDIFQEGIRIPPLKLMKAGVLNQDVLDLILLNCRIPEQNWGDIKAQIASITIAERRVQEMAARYGRDVVAQGIVDLLDAAEARARKLIRALPDGSWQAADYMEVEEGERPIRIDVTMTVAGEEILLDFTGTDLQVAAALNLPSAGQRCHYMLALALLNWLRTQDPDMPYNSGLLRPVRMVLPRGTVLNPDPGAACGVRASTFFRAMDVIMACLAQALPESSPAASAGAVAIILLAVQDPDSGRMRITVAQPLSGGSGARPAQDGIDGASFTGGWLRNVPNEVLEAEMPVLVENYGYRTDAAAAGARRGGAGIDFRLRSLAPELVVTARGLERFHFQAWGLAGGGPGPNTVVTRNPGTPGSVSLGRFDMLRLAEGEVVEFLSPGGGGHGDPLARPVAAMQADLRAGYLSAGRLARDYGAVSRDGQVDPDATALTRARRTPAATRFDAGPAVRAFEALWPAALQRDFIALLLQQPAARRGQLRRRLEPQVEAESRAGHIPDAARLQQLLQAALA